jgi:hypothetical protein
MSWVRIPSLTPNVFLLSRSNGILEAASDQSCDRVSVEARLSGLGQERDHARRDGQQPGRGVVFGAWPTTADAGQVTAHDGADLIVQVQRALADLRVSG